MTADGVQVNGLGGKVILLVMGAVLTGLSGYSISAVRDRYTATDAERDLKRADETHAHLRDQIATHSAGPPHRGVESRLSALETQMQILMRDRENGR